MNATDLSDRQRDIIRLVEQTGFATIDDLADRFSVTTQTIRRDVNDLRDRALLTRVHRGVRPVDGARPYASRAVEQTGEKAALAREVMRLIAPGASVSIGLGSTPAEVARLLAEAGPRDVITNNLVAASHLWDAEDISLSICGGSVRDRSVSGSAAADFFASYRVDVAVFGVAGVDDDGALLDFRASEVRARAAMHAHARQTVLVLDQVKFHRRASARGGWLWDLSHVVTNAPPPLDLAQKLTAQSLVLAG
ncbi:DeoR/GlpR family DNA-binding transcription regulator [Tritonibacter horizontis]|uniref:Glycerol-3-phosphate regulon repressor n=1 Tax=Tritonibacter horizontis TaxID=1768241 RepID=A0A132BXU4_9RHOB|nr:DeoR/GlpR family DNA-binding transcription regulator [Tritonibacter horizontis]KUP92996.1 glycerol-3-phosphate regulon repressor [Tritonibacter horizontis]